MDGSVQVGALDGVVRERIRMALNGHLFVTVLIDEDGNRLGILGAKLWVLLKWARSKAPLVDILEEDLSQYVGRAGAKTLA